MVKKSQLSNEIRRKDGTFRKGHIPWTKGKSPSKETRKKISESRKGVTAWNKGKKIPATKNQLKQLKKLHEFMKGKKLSEEHRKKISQSNKGKKRSEELRRKMSEVSKNPSVETRRKMSISGKNRYLNDPELRKAAIARMIGRKVSVETRRKMSQSLKGIPRTEQWRRKISEAMKRRKPNPERIRKMTKTKNTQESKRRSREIRLHQKFPKNDTIPEKRIQLALTRQGIKFEKHKPIIGQPDIFIQPNICVFVDGDYWHANPKKFKSDKILTGGITAEEKWERDARINQELIKQGYHVIRIWESDIKSDASRCAKNIRHHIQQIMTTQNNS